MVDFILYLPNPPLFSTGLHDGPPSPKPSKTTKKKKKTLPGDRRDRKPKSKASACWCCRGRRYWFGIQTPCGIDTPDPIPPPPCGIIIRRRLLPQLCWESHVICFGSSHSSLAWSSRIVPASICASFSGWLLQHLNHSDFWHQSSKGLTVYFWKENNHDKSQLNR